MTGHSLPDESVALERGHSDIAVNPGFPELIGTALARHGQRYAQFMAERFRWRRHVGVQVHCLTLSSLDIRQGTHC